MRLTETYKNALTLPLQQRLRAEGDTTTRTIDEDGFYALVGQWRVSAVMWKELEDFNKSEHTSVNLDCTIGWHVGDPKIGLNAGWTLSTGYEILQGLSLSALKEALKALEGRPNAWIKIGRTEYDTGLPALYLGKNWVSSAAQEIVDSLKARAVWRVRVGAVEHYTVVAPKVIDCGIHMATEVLDLLGTQQALNGADVKIEAVSGQEIEIIFQKGDKNVRT